MTEFMTTGDIAKEARLCPQAIFAAVQRGELIPVAKTAGGIGLFDIEQARRFVESRKSKKTTK